jgi:RNA polymerase sigma-70 factor, ECF subfamily
MTDMHFGVELAGRIRDGDRAAEDDLIEKYRRAVTALVQRATRGRSEADDLFQDTFRIAIEKLRAGELREPERISGFICGIANHLVGEHFRRVSQRPARPLEAADAEAAGSSAVPDALHQILEQENARIVRQVLNELPLDRDRTVMSRFYISEEPKAAICADTGLSSLQFDQILFRARQRYRVLYEKAIQKK